MTHELVLIAGAAGPADMHGRRRRVEEAAAEIPGAVSWELVEGTTCALALVTTEPLGGTAASVEHRATGPVAVIASHQTMLGRLQQNPDLGGAELAHVRVVLGPDGAVTIGTDGTGLIPSFWATAGRELLFATSLASLVTLGLVPDPDTAGIVEYLVLMHPLGDRTVLRDAHLLPAGGSLVRDADGHLDLEVTRLFTPSDEKMDDDTAVAEFRSTWSEVIGDALSRDPQLALSLSGGLDSRAIATECVRLGARPVSFTYGGLDTFEGRSASAVSAQLGLDHLFMRVTPERMLRDASRIALLLDGAHSAAELYDAWFADRIASVTGGVLNGHAGGPLWGDEKALGTLGEQELVQVLAARYAHELDVVSPFLASDVRVDAGDVLRTSLISSLAEWRPDTRSDAVTFWNVHNRQFRWGNMMPNTLRRLGVRTEAPFLDSRFLRFSARLTPEQRRNGNLYLRVQREVFPETALIPRGDDANPPAHLNHVYWSGESSFATQFWGLAKKHPVSAGRRAARRVRLVGGDAVRRRTPWEDFDDGFTRKRTPFPAADWLRTEPGYRSRLADFLESGSGIGPLDSTTVAKAVGELRGHGSVSSSPLVLARVATLQTWLADFRRRAASARERG